MPGAGQDEHEPEFESDRARRSRIREEAKVAMATSGNQDNQSSRRRSTLSLMARAVSPTVSSVVSGAKTQIKKKFAVFSAGRNKGSQNGSAAGGRNSLGPRQNLMTSSTAAERLGEGQFSPLTGEESQSQQQTRMVEMQDMVNPTSQPEQSKHQSMMEELQDTKVPTSQPEQTGGGSNGSHLGSVRVPQMQPPQPQNHCLSSLQEEILKTQELVVDSVGSTIRSAVSDALTDEFEKQYQDYRKEQDMLERERSQTQRKVQWAEEELNHGERNEPSLVTDAEPTVSLMPPSTPAVEKTSTNQGTWTQHNLAHEAALKAAKVSQMLRNNSGSVGSNSQSSPNLFEGSNTQSRDMGTSPFCQSTESPKRKRRAMASASPMDESEYSEDINPEGAAKFPRVDPTFQIPIRRSNKKTRDSNMDFERTRRFQAALKTQTEFQNGGSHQQTFTTGRRSSCEPYMNSVADFKEMQRQVETMRRKSDVAILALNSKERYGEVRSKRYGHSCPDCDANPPGVECAEHKHDDTASTTFSDDVIFLREMHQKCASRQSFLHDQIASQGSLALNRCADLGKLVATYSECEAQRRVDDLQTTRNMYNLLQSQQEEQEQKQSELQLFLRQHTERLRQGFDELEREKTRLQELTSRAQPPDRSEFGSSGGRLPNVGAQSQPDLSQFQSPYEDFRDGCRDGCSESDLGYQTSGGRNHSDFEQARSASGDVNNFIPNLDVSNPSSDGKPPISEGPPCYEPCEPYQFEDSEKDCEGAYAMYSTPHGNEFRDLPPYSGTPEQLKMELQMQYDALHHMYEQHLDESGMEHSEMASQLAMLRDQIDQINPSPVQPSHQEVQPVQSEGEVCFSGRHGEEGTGEDLMAPPPPPQPQGSMFGGGRRMIPPSTRSTVGMVHTSNAYGQRGNAVYGNGPQRQGGSVPFRPPGPGNTPQGQGSNTGGYNHYGPSMGRGGSTGAPHLPQSSTPHGHGGNTGSHNLTQTPGQNVSNTSSTAGDRLMDSIASLLQTTSNVRPNSQKRDKILKNFTFSDGTWIQYESFKKSFRNYTDIFQWSKAEAATELYVALGGEAKTRINDLPVAAHKDADVMLDCLDKIYCPPNQNEVAYNDFWSTSKGNETLRKHVDTLMMKLTRAKPGSSQKDKEMEIKRHLQQRLPRSEFEIIQYFMDDPLEKIVCKADTIATNKKVPIILEYDKTLVREDGSILLDHMATGVPLNAVQTAGSGATQNGAIPNQNQQPGPNQGVQPGSNQVAQVEPIFAMQFSGGGYQNRGYSSQGNQVANNQGNQGFYNQGNQGFSNQGNQGNYNQGYNNQGNQGNQGFNQGNQGGQGFNNQGGNQQQQPQSGNGGNRPGGNDQNNGGGGRGRGRGRRNVKCKFCGVWGHTEDECFRKRDLEAREAERQKQEASAMRMHEESISKIDALTQALQGLVSGHLNLTGPPPGPGQGGS